MPDVDLELSRTVFGGNLLELDSHLRQRGQEQRHQLPLALERVKSEHPRPAHRLVAGIGPLEQVALGLERRPQRQAAAREALLHRTKGRPRATCPGAPVCVVKEGIGPRRSRVVGDAGVGGRVGDGQEITGLGPEDEIGHLVVEDVEVEVRPGERHAAGEHLVQPFAGHVLHLCPAAEVVVDDPQLGDAVLPGPSDKGRPRVSGAGSRCHGRVDRRETGPRGSRTQRPDDRKSPAAIIPVMRFRAELD